MRIGILTDIHEYVEPLREALELLQRSAVDRIVTLGDTCDVFSGGRHARETVALLRSVQASGVWGNHDVSLCRNLSDDLRQRYDPAVLEFMATMQPHLVIGDCLFSHVEPWLDPNDPAQLWCYDGPPETRQRLDRSFSAVPQRFLFMGHLHRWHVMTPAGVHPWAGEGPIVLDPADRYLAVIAPVFSGCCATFDTQTTLLTPLQVGAGGWSRIVGV